MGCHAAGIDPSRSRAKRVNDPMMVERPACKYEGPTVTKRIQRDPNEHPRPPKGYPQESPRGAEKRRREHQGTKGMKLLA